MIGGKNEKNELLIPKHSPPRSDGRIDTTPAPVRKKRTKAYAANRMKCSLENAWYLSYHSRNNGRTASADSKCTPADNPAA